VNYSTRKQVDLAATVHCANAGTHPQNGLSSTVIELTIIYRSSPRLAEPIAIPLRCQEQPLVTPQLPHL
jgi:hypothetical protein